MDYRGEITAIFDIISDSKLPYYAVGDRICQMEIVPVLQVEFEECDELSETKRWVGGFGSTGK